MYVYMYAYTYMLHIGGTYCCYNLLATAICVSCVSPSLAHSMPHLEACESTIQQATLATTAMRSRAVLMLATTAMRSRCCPDASYYTMQVGLQADMTCVRSDGESFATRARPLARSYVIACLCPRPSTPTDAPPATQAIHSSCQCWSIGPCIRN